MTLLCRRWCIGSSSWVGEIVKELWLTVHAIVDIVSAHQAIRRLK